MFKLAKSLSPDTLLFLNDYGIIMDRWEQLWEKLWEPLLVLHFLSPEMVGLHFSNSK